MLILLEETTCIGHKKEQPEDDSQQTLDHLIQHTRKYDPKNPKQVLVTEAVFEFVAGDLMPLSVVDSVRFQKLLTLCIIYQQENPCQQNC